MKGKQHGLFAPLIEIQPGILFSQLPPAAYQGFFSNCLPRSILFPPTPNNSNVVGGGREGRSKLNSSRVSENMYGSVTSSSKSSLEQTLK
ncbi:hypothetical protein CEXT_772971 [Caerostris extrusa]|uniref:Uncharacterized protein n=1 Tax=Caerostris extrusa TaxID=172846 RepID=A0AAV4M695_CAEEX|nr:hypothetical protein CEXT_772971 [Caerostris extrusa]